MPVLPDHWLSSLAAGRPGQIERCVQEVEAGGGGGHGGSTRSLAVELALPDR